MNPSLNALKPKIFIAGSSWARGEWQGPRVAHPGILQYFSDSNYTVIDSSQARSYHTKVIDHLDKKLETQYKKDDIIFFIMADPLLDLIMPELESMRVKRTIDVKNLPQLTNSIKQAGGLINLIRNQQDQIYNQLNTIAKKYHATIHCIGGTYNVNTNIMNKYDNLQPTVVSWIHLLAGQYQEHPGTDDPEFGITYTWNIDYVDLSTYPDEFAKQVRQEFFAISDHTKILNELIFHPDGLHPNREGHKILYNHLVEKLKL